MTSRSSRGVRVNKRYRDESDDADDSKLPRRRCERHGCPSEVPICFARVADRCAGSKWTSRWYHITPAEHFCNECFEYFYRSHKHGHQLFEEWKRDWAAHGSTEATLKKFMCDSLVPYWVQCTRDDCRKWRQLSKDVTLKPTFIDKYVCGMSASGMKKGNQKDACSNPEDERVSCVLEDIWLKQATVPPYLKESPAAPMLLGYYPDGVGCSATDPFTLSTQSKPTAFPCCEFISPFVQSEGRSLAGMAKPDMMGKEEIAAFPLLAEFQPYAYLAIRNLVMAVWTHNAKTWVSRDDCGRRLICRGLNRAWCVSLLDPILAFLTDGSYINVGLVAPPPPLRLHTGSQCDVLVLGAGASGVAAAHRLSHFGLKVKVLESKGRVGGRIMDEVRSGALFAHGAQLLAGAVNNPLAIMAYQCGERVVKVKDRCQLLQGAGRVVDPVTDRRLDFHFNALLDALGRWRDSGQPDVSLDEKYKELHQEFEDETQLKFTKEEERILQFHVSSLEYVGGCHAGRLSARHWDQKEAMPQFGDPHLLLPTGYGTLLQRLAQGMDIIHHAKVTKVDYRGDGVVVQTASGEEYKADKVLVTLPLAVLQSDAVAFEPPLPDAKVKAISSLGVGRVEKVILQFSENFWRKKTKGDDFFGHVPSSESTRGLFNLFYTFSSQQSEASKKETHVLVTHIVGQALDLVKGKTDAEVKDMCLKTLRSIFPGKIPPPVNWAVTSWHADPDIQMTHSFLPVGIGGETMDALALPVDTRLYFAGEATCRQFPQSVAGAYLSGLREAHRILDNVASFLDDQESQADSLDASVRSEIDADIEDVKTATIADKTATATDKTATVTDKAASVSESDVSVNDRKREPAAIKVEILDEADEKAMEVACDISQDGCDGETATEAPSVRPTLEETHTSDKRDVSADEPMECDVSDREGVSGGACDREGVSGACDREGVSGACDREGVSGGACDREGVSGDACDREGVSGDVCDSGRGGQEFAVKMEENETSDNLTSLENENGDVSPTPGVTFRETGAEVSGESSVVTVARGEEACNSPQEDIDGVLTSMRDVENGSINGGGGDCVSRSQENNCVKRRKLALCRKRPLPQDDTTDVVNSVKDSVDSGKDRPFQAAGTESLDSVAAGAGASEGGKDANSCTVNKDLHQNQTPLNGTSNI